MKFSFRKLPQPEQIFTSTKIPGFQGLTVSKVWEFFFDGLRNGVLHVRASSVAFNTFLAIPPSILFLFTLIPYIPIPNFDVMLMEIIRALLPQASFNALESTLYEVVTHKKGGLLSFGFLFSFIFSTNGMHNLIVSFDATAHDTIRKNWLTIRLNSFLMVMMQFVLVMLAVGLIFYGKETLEYLIAKEYLKNELLYYVINIGKLPVIVLLFFSAISSLYLMAPVKKESWSFVSSGAILATFLSLIISWAFSYFVNQFGQHNKLYGSIGTLMASMLWIYLNSFSIILGFELNISIKRARRVINASS